MNVLVIGATGQTGQLALPKLLAANHHVTALVRKPAEFKVQHARLRVVGGDARDAKSLKTASQEQQAVLSVFGPRSLKADNLQETYMRNLIAAMNANGVKRLVNLSAWGAGDSAVHAKLLFKIIKGTVLRRVYIDKDRGEALLVASNLDFVNVRPGRLIHGPARGNVRASLDGSGLKPMMTRDDLADFMIEALTRQEWLRKSPIIGY